MIHVGAARLMSLGSALPCRVWRWLAMLGAASMTLQGRAALGSVRAHAVSRLPGTTCFTCQPGARWSAEAELRVAGGSPQAPLAASRGV